MTVRAGILVVVIGLALAALLDAVWNGFSLGNACGFGFGPRQRSVEETAVRSMFVERLPDEIRIRNFQCAGFQDLSMTFDLGMANADATLLLEGLDRTYGTKQNAPYLSDDRKERRRVRHPDDVRTDYLLPGVPPLYVRSVVVTVPVDDARPAAVSYRGWQF